MVIPYERLKRDFERLKQECHEQGLSFYSGENRLRSMGDSLTCCGIDNIEGFIPNTFNLSHLLNGDIQHPTEAQKQKDTARCFQTVYQTAGYFKRIIKGKSFEECMNWTAKEKKKYVYSVLGIGEYRK